MGSATYIIISYWRYCDCQVFHLGRENVRGVGGLVNASALTTAIAVF